MSLVSIRDPNIFNKCLHLGGWRAGELGNYYRYGKVEQHADTTYAFRRNAKPPIGLHVGFRVYKLELDDVSGGEQDPSNHASDGAFLVHALVKDTQNDRREKTASG